MKHLLKEITNIQTGLFAKPLGEGDVIYLQTKHFDENGQLTCTLHGDLLSNYISEKHLLKTGDILFSAKGTKNFAAVYENHNAPAVASTSFFVLRPASNNVLSEYIAWFLNNQVTQALLKGKALGTSMPSISKQVLEDLEIPLPDLTIQKTILEISKLRIKEKELKLEIETLREKQIQQQFVNAIK